MARRLFLGYPYYVPPLVWITQNAADEAGIASSYLDAAGFFAEMLFNKWAGSASISLGWPWVMGLLGASAIMSAAMFAPVDLEPKTPKEKSS